MVLGALGRDHAGWAAVRPSSSGQDGCSLGPRLCRPLW